MHFCGSQLKIYKTYFKMLKGVLKGIVNILSLCGDKQEYIFNTSPF